jgi:hypothetical protein
MTTQVARSAMDPVAVWNSLVKAILEISNPTGQETLQVNVQPTGNYSGHIVQTLSGMSGIVTNPWGTQAGFGISGRGGDNRMFYTLAPGQSYNFATGAYSDPNLHAATAARLNEAAAKRSIDAAGTVGASATTSRNSNVTALATLDQLYFGNASTSASTSAALSNMAQASAAGYSTGADKTVLGIENPQTTSSSTSSKVVIPRALK